MRVLLLNPPFQAPKHAGLGLSFPLGLGYLATALKNAGIDVVAVDGAAEGPASEIGKGVVRHGLPPEQLRKRIDDSQPDVVGIGCFFSSRFPGTMEAARIVKSIDPKIITVTGGVHPSLVPEKVCSQPEIDFVIIGEGEDSFVRLIKALDNNGDPSSVDGLAFRRNGSIVVNPKTEYVPDLDSLGPPDWELLHLECYLALHEGRWDLGGGRYAPIVTSRGCPYRCNFCCIHEIMGPKYRVRSPGHVLNEIETLVTKYGVDEISFEDDNLTHDRERFLQICQGIVERKLRIKWNTPNGVHVGSLDEEALRWASKSGCDSLNLAIESGDETIRNRVIKKRLTKEKIYEVAEACHRVGIKPNAYFVIGMPGETDESINNTRKFIQDLKFNNLSVFVATPIPGTRLYDECVDKGYIRPDLYDDEFVNFRASIFTQPSIETPEFDRQKVALWRHRLLMAYWGSSLQRGFFERPTNSPRAWLAMLLKVLLYRLLGERLSLALTERIRGILKR